MSHTICYEQGRIAHVLFAGVLAASDVLKASQKIHNDPRFDTLKGLINDFTAVTDIPEKVDASDLDDLSAATIGASMHKPRLRVAVVTTSKFIADMSLVYLEATEGAWTVKVFATLDTARVWMATPDASGFRMPTRR